MRAAFAGCGTLVLAVAAVALFAALEEALDLAGAASFALFAAALVVAVAAGVLVRRVFGPGD